MAGLMGAAMCLSGTPLSAQQPARNLALQQTARPVAAQEQRVALVIGNNAYKEAPLTNPVNDAKAMADALREAGFAVTLRTDITHREFLGALRDFGDALRKGGVGIFYFAGHGMQIKGRNYLIPAGATIEREDEVAYAAVDAQAVLDKMEAAGNATNLMILDACRNNPFARSFRSSVQGLAQMEAPLGTLVAFATAPGAVASDGTGQNGLYTQHLLQAMRVPGVKVEDVFKQTRAAVRRDSQGKQIPWESTSMEGDFYFVPARAPAPVPAPVPVPPQPPTAALTPAPGPAAFDTAAAVEEAFWSSVRDGLDVTELRVFLKRYPQGRNAEQARRLLALLESAAPKPPVVAPIAVMPTAPAPLAVATPRPQPVAAPQVGTSVAVAGPVPMPAPARRDPAQQAEIDRVTEALLADASRRQPPAPAPVAAAGTPVPPAAAHRANAHGYTVGDKWNYQVVDRVKGEVVRNYALQVGRIEADGSWVSGKARLDEAGRLRRFEADNGDAREYSPHAPRWWPGMKVGDSQRLDFEYRSNSPNGSNWVNRGQSEARVLKHEMVRVPAGEFDALLVEIKGRVEAVARAGLGTFTFRIWYSPELHTSVAFEETSYWNGRLDVNTREELTSLRLVKHPDSQTVLPPELAPQPTSAQQVNVQGYTVGEQWRYRRQDRRSDRMPEERVQRVERIDSQGAVVFGGSLDDAPWDQFARGLLAASVPGVALPVGRTDLWWSDMKDGDSRSVRFQSTQLSRAGAVKPTEVSVQLKRHGMERIRVPAGEFEAVRLVGDGSHSFVGIFNEPVGVLWQLSAWYVPALRALVATELRTRTDLVRLELTGFHLLSGPLAVR
jgi:hypothetical protein